MRALISVYDKRNLEQLARGLQELGVEIISTGGTYEALRSMGVEARSVSDVTGFPEILDGRVKTLHPAIHGGILADRSKPAHLQELQAQGIAPIDVVVVNLYPFVQTVSSAQVSLEEALEQVDIGGVALIRAAAKNFRDVLVVTDPRDYDDLREELRRRGAGDAPGTAEDAGGFAQSLAAKAFAYTASYDSYIASYLRPRTPTAPAFPETLVLPMRKVQDLRYGENPHQKGAFYTTVPTTEEIGLRTLATARQLHGKELSFNNLLDLDAAWTTVRDFRGPTCAVIKHTNPCGLASRATLAEAYEAAHAGDPVAAYGGIVAVNHAVDRATAEAMSAVFYEAVIAPEFSEEALDILGRKKNLRLLAIGERSGPRKGEFGWLPDNRLDFKRVTGGFVVQGNNVLRDEDITLQVVSKRQPTFAEITDLKFAWKSVKHIKSNGIVLVKHLAVVGVGAGQMKRVDSVDLAVRHAGDRSGGSVLASDAYFPFADGVERAIEAGVTAIIQPGGSIRDDEAIAAADSQGVAMVFTGTRHFKH